MIKSRNTKTVCLALWVLAYSYWVISELLTMQEYVTAVFHETLRLFSSVPRLGKRVFSDTVIRTRRFTTNPDGTLDKVEVVNTPIKAGSVVVLDVHGMHYNRT